MALKAVAFRVILKVKEVAEKSKGGIVLALDKRLERQAYTEGTVVDIGPDAWSGFKPKQEFAGLKVGDTVFYAKYAGKWIRDPETDEEFLIVNDEDIVAKVG
jgi:co-chaperonin GroES (HSP10)